MLKRLGKICFVLMIILMPEKWVKADDVDLSSWMADETIPNSYDNLDTLRITRFQKLHINQLYLPGALEPETAYVNGFTDDDMKKQTEEVSSLLQKGVRYFEMNYNYKLQNNESQNIKDTLGKMLGQIKSFVEDNDKEIIVLNFKTFSGKSDNEKAEIASTLSENLGTNYQEISDKVILTDTGELDPYGNKIKLSKKTDDFSKTMTLQEAQDQGKNIFVIMNNTSTKETDHSVPGYSRSYEAQKNVDVAFVKKMIDRNKQRAPGVYVYDKEHFQGTFDHLDRADTVSIKNYASIIIQGDFKATIITQKNGSQALSKSFNANSGKDTYQEIYKIADNQQEYIDFENALLTVEPN